MLMGLLPLISASGACGPASLSDAPELLAEDPPVVATASPSIAPSPPMTTPTAAPVHPLTLIAVGDMMLDRSVGQRVLSEGPDIVFGEELAGILRAADITVGNLECAISERGEPQLKGYTFRAPPSTVAVLEGAGFDVVALANNHALDYGPLALQDTVAYLERSRIRAAGAGPDLASAQSATIVEAAGLRVAFVSLADVPAEGAGFSRETWEAGDGRWGIAWADADTVASSVSIAARSADIVVAMMHFGHEYATTPSAGQRALAHAAIDAGASLVIGTHPHVLQEVEEYGGGLIAYSLGNFVFDGFDGPSNESAILRVTLTGEGIGDWELVPVSLVENGLPRLR